MLTTSRVATPMAAWLSPLAALAISASQATEPVFEAFRWNEDYRHLADKAQLSTLESLTR